MLPDASEVEVTAQEMAKFYGDDARKIASKNIGLGRWTCAGRKFWIAVWKYLSERNTAQC